MKKTITLIISSCFFLIAQVQATKTLNINLPGTLSTALTTDELANVDSLMITGIIDASDFLTMVLNLPKLTYLDIANVTIAAYTGTQGPLGTSTYTYPANELPACAFNNNNYSHFIVKTTLKTISLPNSIISIGYNAFFQCAGLKSITIPNSVTKIGNSSFFYCIGLSSIIIPNSVTSIGDGAFERCTGITNLSIGNSVNSIGDNCFCDCSGLTDLILPNSVTYLGSHSFDSCTGLTSIKISDSVTSLLFNVFYFCIGLKTLTIPNTITTIGTYAFGDCSGLTSIIIPSSVTSIADFAFGSCTGLTKIYAYSANPINLSTFAFYTLNKANCTLYVPLGSKTLYQTANQWKDFQNIVEMTTALPTISESNIKVMTGRGILTIENAMIGNKIEIYLPSGVKTKEQLIENCQTNIPLSKGVYILRIGNYSEKVAIN